MSDPFLGIPFEVVVFAGLLLGVFFGIWSARGMRDAYRSIGHGRMSLDVPFTDPERVDRGGSR
jgi:hypothetical protein